MAEEPHTPLDHAWRREGRRWKCRLCGAVTVVRPPSPTPADWMPWRYEALSDEDRDWRREALGG